MKTQRVICASALVLAAAAAGAVEATQLPIEASTLTRAEVRAELARARAAGETVNGEDADWRASRAVARSDPPGAVVRNRAEVRREARLVTHAPAVDPLYVGG